ncbi:MAG: VrlD [Desulfatitalea sp.]
MIVRRKGVLTKFIPSPQEKREGLIRDHILGLVENLHRRIERLECKAGLPDKESEAFKSLYQRIQNDENRNLELHASLITGGSMDT